MVGYKSDGKPNRKSFYGHSRTEAHSKYIEYLVSQASKKNTVLFSNFAKEWYKSQETMVRPQTYANYKYTLDPLINEFGNINISDIKEKDIENFLIKERKAKYSDSKTSKERGMLYEIFNRAVANDIINKNPVAYVPKMKGNGPKTQKKPFTADEVRLLFEKLPDNTYGNITRLMLATGLRLGEALALEPKHLDVENRTIYVRQAINSINGHVEIGDPKNGNAIRDIIVPEEVLPIMEKLKKTNFKYISQRVPDAGPCTEKTFRENYYKYLNALKVQKLSPHCCRHTYVTLMQGIGVPMETIEGLAGHSDISMTKHYLHIQDSVKIDATNKFGEAFCTKIPKPEDENNAVNCGNIAV